MDGGFRFAAQENPTFQMIRQPCIGLKKLANPVGSDMLFR
jgi:hypothetical protein